MCACHGETKVKGKHHTTPQTWFQSSPRKKPLITIKTSTQSIVEQAAILGSALGTGNATLEEALDFAYKVVTSEKKCTLDIDWTSYGTMVGAKD